VTESQKLEPARPKTRKVSIQERSVLVGSIIVVNGFRANRTLLKQRFAEGRYEVRQTAHFLLFRRELAPTTILVHCFAPDTPPSAIQAAIRDELACFDLLQQPDDQKRLLDGILASIKIQELRIQERCVAAGELRVMSSYGLDQRLLKQRLFQSGYQMQETPHFLLFTRREEPSIILVHTFRPEEFNADIKHYLFYELQPLGLVKQSSDYGKIVSGIVGSFHPEATHDAWHNFAANSLQRFLLFLSTAHTPTVYNFYATIGIFAHWYQRVCELCVGETFLDAGCDAGFLPLVIAERIPFMRRIVGVDIRPDMFAVMRQIAAEQHLSGIEFIQADLRSVALTQLGTFDTVTVLGVIEHFTEMEMYPVLTNLLRITTHRLIITVPYEEQPETIYEHKQTFTRQKLEEVGAWCVEQLGGHGRIWCEDCLGGLLLVERLT
jgi:SAM-dependent methyltransferase